MACAARRHAPPKHAAVTCLSHLWHHLAVSARIGIGISRIAGWGCHARHTLPCRLLTLPCQHQRSGHDQCRVAGHGRLGARRPGRQFAQQHQHDGRSRRREQPQRPEQSHCRPWQPAIDQQRPGQLRGRVNATCARASRWLAIATPRVHPVVRPDRCCHGCGTHCSNPLHLRRSSIPRGVEARPRVR